MTGNSENNVNNILEENTKKMTPAQAKAQLIQEYLKKKLKTPESIAFLNEIDESRDIPESMKKDLLFYIKTVSKYGDVLTESDIEGLTYMDVIPEVTGVITSLRTKRTALKNIFLREYNISSSKYDKDLEPIIKKLDENGLAELLDMGEEERRDLLVEVYGKKIPEKKNLTRFINDFNLKWRLKKLSPDERERFDYTLSLIYQKKGHLDTGDLEELFDLWIFTESEKKELVSIFIPTMSLANARLLGIVSETEETKIRNKYVDEGIAYYELKKWLSDSELEALRTKIFADLETKDLMIEIAGLKDFDKVLWKLIDAWELEKIVAWYNNVLYKAEEQIWETENYDQFEKKLTESIWKLQAQKFQPWSTLALREQDAQWETHTFFFEILNNGENTWNIVLKPRGKDSYDRYDSGKMWAKSFDEVLGIVNNSFEWKTGKKVLWFQVLDEFDLKKQIESWNIELDHDSVKFLDDAALKQEKENVKESLNERKKELRDAWKRNIQIENDPQVQDLKEKQKELFDDTESLEIKNQRLLNQALDNLDPDWKKYGFHENTTFKSQKGWVFTVKHINPISNTIVIFSPSAPWGTQEMSYTDFVTAFKSESAKRISSSKTFEQLLEQVSSENDISSEWSKFHIDNGEIRLKDGKKKIDYDFLVGEDNELIKIVDINDGTGIATINFWTVEQKKEHNTGKKGEKLEDDTYMKETFRVDPTKHQVTMGWLEDYIKSNKQIPRGLEEWKAEETNFKNDDSDRSGSFMSRLFKNNFSIFEIVSGSKLMLENLQAYLKEWADEHSAQFAKSFFWKFLPDEVKADLSSRLESAQKKRSDEYIDKLKSIDSGPATEMIGKWLKNKDVPQYKLEAGLLFMMEKYGTLYCKWIYEDDGKYLWYRALWGKVWDELFMKEYRETQEADQPFSEEQLVFALLWKQIKPWGYNWIQRRSRIQKDYKAVRIQWKKDEIEKGKDDALRFRQVQWRVDGGMWELYSGNYPNAVGWIEQIVNKGGTYAQMNKLPFVMAFSWIMFDFDDAYILDQIKAFSTKSQILPITTLMSKKSDMKLLDKTIYQVISRLEDSWKYPGIQAKADKIIGMRGDIKKAKIIEATDNFYKEYGDVLTDILSQANYAPKSQNETQEFNKMILLEKDPGVWVDWKHQWWNNTFKEYYNHIRGFMDGDWQFKEEWLMADGMAWIGVTWSHMRKVVKQNLTYRTAWYPNMPWSIKLVWKEISNTLKSIAKTSYYWLNLESRENKEVQERLMIDVLKNLLSWILDAHGADPKVLQSYEGWIFSNLSNDWNIQISKDLVDQQTGRAFDPEAIMNASEDSSIGKKLQKMVDWIIRFEQWWVSLNTQSSGPTKKQENSFELIEKGTKDTLKKIVDEVDYDFLWKEVPDDIHVDLDKFKKDGAYNRSRESMSANNRVQEEYDLEEEA